MTILPNPPNPNPYAAPRSNVDGMEADSSELVLADRGTRLGASLLDGLITGIPMMVLIWAMWMAFGFGILTPPKGPTALLTSLIALVISAGVSFAINGYLLAKYGQSVGKRICGIRIVRQDGSLPTLWDSFAKRQVVILIIGQIPVVGGLFGLVDVLFIFKEDRRCLHDRIAGTLVVKGSPAPVQERPIEPAAPPKEVVPAVAEPVDLELCPYCAEPVSEFTNLCRGCGRKPFQVDGPTANRSLTVEELQQKAAKLYGHGLKRDALEVHVVATKYHPNQKVAWQGLLDAPNADAALKAEAQSELARIEKILHG